MVSAESLDILNTSELPKTFVEVKEEKLDVYIGSKCANHLPTSANVVEIHKVAAHGP